MANTLIMTGGGWDSVVISVTAKYYLSSSTAFTGGTPINFDTKSFDSSNSVTTGASWQFTAPISGVYSVSITGNASVGGSAVAVYKNGVQDTYLLSYNTSAITSGHTLISLNAGDYISIVPDNTFTLDGSSPAHSTVSINFEGY